MFWQFHSCRTWASIGIVIGLQESLGDIGVGEGRQSKMANLRAEKNGQLGRLSKYYKDQNLVRESLWKMAKAAIHSDDPKGPENGEMPGLAARYIGAMAGELAKIAKSNRLDTLGTILEMARLEAEQAQARVP